MMERNLLREPGPFDVVVAARDGAPVDVETRYGRQARDPVVAPLPGLVEQLFPKGRVVSAPALQAEVVAAEPRRSVGSHQRRFDEQGSGTAHGIQQRLAGFGHGGPAGVDQHCRGNVFLQRCRTALAAVPAPVEAVAGEIDGDGGHVSVQVGVNAHVRSCPIHRRSRPAQITQLIDDGVLDLLSAEMRVAYL